MPRRLMFLARQVFRQPTPPGTIEHFLKARNALLWLSDTNSQSFNGQTLQAETEINTFGLSLHLSIKRTVAGLHITLADKAPRGRVIDLPVSITAAAQKIRLNFDNLELNIELGRAAS